jgi:hypothetical protein
MAGDSAMATVKRDQGIRPGSSAVWIDRRRRRHGTAGEFGHSIALTSGASLPHLRRRLATRSVEVSWPTRAPAFLRSVRFIRGDEGTAEPWPSWRVNGYLA